MNENTLFRLSFNFLVLLLFEFLFTSYTTKHNFAFLGILHTSILNTRVLSISNCPVSSNALSTIFCGSQRDLPP